MDTTELPTKNLIDIARTYAIRCHEDTNHRYGDKPYSYHLQMVFDFACKYKHLLKADIIPYALAGAWTHDVCEDCRETFNDIKEICGEQVAQITYALTNEKGKSRAERSSNKYYSEMWKIDGARFLKICDRLANVKNSVDEGSSMAKKYRQESTNFHCKLYSTEYKPMFDELEALFSQIP